MAFTNTLGVSTAYDINNLVVVRAGQVAQLPGVTLTVQPESIAAEAMGNGAIFASFTRISKATVTGEHVGISYKAYGIMTGQTANENGAVGNRIRNIQIVPGSCDSEAPYFEVRGETCTDDGTKFIVIATRCKIKTYPPIQMQQGQITMSTFTADALADPNNNGIAVEWWDYEDPADAPDITAP